MNQDQLNNIERTLGILLGKIDGINQRLDTSNGRIGKLEDQENCIKSEIDQIKGKSVILGSVAAVVVSVGLAVFNWLLGK